MLLLRTLSFFTSCLQLFLSRRGRRRLSTSRAQRKKKGGDIAPLSSFSLSQPWTRTSSPSSATAGSPLLQQRVRRTRRRGRKKITHGKALGRKKSSPSERAARCAPVLLSSSPQRVLRSSLPAHRFPRSRVKHLHADPNTHKHQTGDDGMREQRPATTTTTTSDRRAAATAASVSKKPSPTLPKKRPTSAAAAPAADPVAARRSAAFRVVERCVVVDGAARFAGRGNGRER